MAFSIEFRLVMLMFIVPGTKQPVVKGITHCLLPNCNEVVWPFMKYCCRSHADEGIKDKLERK